MLILSAMSLSDGGFSKEETAGQDVVSVIAKEDYDELERRLKETEARFVAVKNEEIQARKEADNARKAEADAKSETEIERANARKAKAAEEQAKAEAAAERQRADKAQALEAQLRADVDAERLAAKESKAAAERADKEAEANRIAARKAKESEAQAKAEAEFERQNANKARALEAQSRAEVEAERAVARELKSAEERAKADAENERQIAKAARMEADVANAKLVDILAKQKALMGNIPHNIIWEMTIHCNVSGNQKEIILYSPLVSTDGNCRLFFEQSQLDGISPEDVSSIAASRGDLEVEGFICITYDNLCFVDIGDVSQHPHIDFGVETINLNGILVFNPKTGSCEGPVSGKVEADGNFLFPVKTETRTTYQHWKGDHSVYEGCLLLSKDQGAVAAIVRERASFLGAWRKCEILHPINLTGDGKSGNSGKSNP